MINKKNVLLLSILVSSLWIGSINANTPETKPIPNHMDVDCVESDSSFDFGSPLNLDCSSAINIDCGVTIPGNNATGVSNEDLYCTEASLTGNELVYTFTPLGAGANTVITLGELSGDLDLFLLESCDNSVCVGKSNNGGTTGETISALLTNQQYYIVVDGYNGASSPFELTISSCGCIPNQITVSSNSDSGPGTLREAVTNICDGGEIIIPTGFEISFETAISIDKPMTIKSADIGIGSTFDGGSFSTRLFNIINTTGVFFEKINFKEASGSAITVNNATVDFYNCNIFDNSNSINSGVNGGAIKAFNNSTLNVKLCAFYGNVAVLGGAIFIGASATLNAEYCTFMGNQASNSGGAIYGNGDEDGGGIMNLFHCTFAYNECVDLGGAIRTSDQITMKGCIVYDNASATAPLSANFEIIVAVPTSLGANIFESVDGINNFTPNSTDLIGVDPLLEDILIDPVVGNNLICKSLPFFLSSPAFDGANDCHMMGLSPNGETLPTNDACDIGAYEYREVTNACDALIDINCGDILSGNSTGNELYTEGELNPGFGQAYKFVATSTGEMTFTLNNFVGFLALGVGQGNCTENSNASGSGVGGTDEEIEYTVAMSAGLTYEIFISGGESAFMLELNCTIPQCNDLISLACGMTTDDNSDYIIEFEQPCEGFTSPGKMYEIIPDVSGTLVVKLNNFDSDLDLFLFDAICGTSCANIADGATTSSEEMVSYEVTAGETYYVYVLGYQGAVSTYNLEVDCPALPVACENVTDVSCGSTYFENNSDLQIFPYNSCGSPDGNDTTAYVDIYQFNHYVGGSININLTGLSADLDLKLFSGSGTDCNTSCLAFSEAIGSADELLTYSILPGVDYYIAVKGFQGAQSTYSFSISCPIIDCNSDYYFTSPDADFSSTLDIFITTEGYIGANNRILDNSNLVSYQAGEYISLDPGFEVELGSQFEAKIGACENERAVEKLIDEQ